MSINFKLVWTLLLLVAPLASAADDQQFVSLVQKGDLEDSQHHTQSALASFVEAEKLAPDRADVLLRIAKQYSDLIEITKDKAEAERYAEAALKYSKRSLELAPENAKAHLSLAVAYGKLTDFRNNRTKLEYSEIIKSETVRSIELDPNDDFAYHVLGRWHYGVATISPVLRVLARVVYGGMPDASLDESVRNLKKATELAPARVIHHSELARAYFAQGKKDLARQEWQTVLKLPATDSDGREAQQEAREGLKK